MKAWQAWLYQPRNKHTWAFFYFLKRQGDRPWVTHNPDGTVNIYREL